LIAGTDPVALDRTGWRLIEEIREEEGMKSLRQLGREPTYIHTAADDSHRLGTDDPERIDVVNV
jgi:hypothetical protein